MTNCHLFKIMILHNAHFNGLGRTKCIAVVNTLLSCMLSDTQADSCWTVQEGRDTLATVNVQTQTDIHADGTPMHTK